LYKTTFIFFSPASFTVFSEHHTGEPDFVHAIEYDGTESFLSS